MNTCAIWSCTRPPRFSRAYHAYLCPQHEALLDLGDAGNALLAAASTTAPRQRALSGEGE